MITSIKRRDGREIYFLPEKITRTILLAANRVAQEGSNKTDYETAEILTEKVVDLLSNIHQGTTSIMESVRDVVIKVLIETGHTRTSEAHILYRAERTRIRSMKIRLMKPIEKITLMGSNDANIKRENANIDGNTVVGTIL